MVWRVWNTTKEVDNPQILHADNFKYYLSFQKILRLILNLKWANYILIDHLNMQLKRLKIIGDYTDALFQTNQKENFLL